MVNGYCLKCFKTFEINSDKSIARNPNETVTCPTCGRTMTVKTAYDNYKDSLTAQNGDNSKMRIAEIQDEIAAVERKSEDRRKQLQELQEQIKKEEEEAARKKEELMQKLNVSRGINIYDDKDADLVPVTVKITREMNQLINETIKFYYKGSMATYIQSLIAEDIKKNLSFYDKYNETHTKKPARARREDVAIREDFISKMRNEYGFIAPKTRDDQNEFAVESALTELITDGTYTIEINGIRSKYINIYDIFAQIKLEFNDFAAGKDDIGDGMPVSLVYHGSDGDKRINKFIVQDIGKISNIREHKIRSTVVALDLYDIFLKSNFIKVVLAELVHPERFGEYAIKQRDAIARAAERDKLDKEEQANRLMEYAQRMKSINSSDTEPTDALAEYMNAPVPVEYDKDGNMLPITVTVSAKEIGSLVEDTVSKAKAAPVKRRAKRGKAQPVGKKG